MIKAKIVGIDHLKKSSKEVLFRKGNFYEAIEYGL